MSFPESVEVAALAACERCCCICHKFCGTKIELHHIKQKADGGEDIEKLFADDVIVLDGGNASGHSSKCTSVSTENTINISGMKTALEEFAKHLPKIEMSEKVFGETDDDGMLTDESSFAHFDGVGKKIEII